MTARAARGGRRHDAVNLIDRLSDSVGNIGTSAAQWLRCPRRCILHGLTFSAPSVIFALQLKDIDNTLGYLSAILEGNVSVPAFQSVDRGCR